jgi:hypothetical protein
MIDNRQFLIDDIKAMTPNNTQDLLSTLSQESLYRLWLELVNLNQTEEKQL